MPSETERERQQHQAAERERQERGERPQEQGQVGIAPFAFGPTGAAVEPYSITPTLGVALNMTWVSAVGGTGPQMPGADAQLGLIPGKVMHATDANKYMLMRSAASLAANAAVTTGPPGFVVGTGTGFTGTAPNFAIPANALFWALMGPA